MLTTAIILSNCNPILDLSLLSLYRQKVSKIVWRLVIQLNMTIESNLEIATYFLCKSTFQQKTRIQGGQLGCKVIIQGGVQR